uniref:non-specific serine/threonine protein kinase n=1 Tax=Fagus sylvatica TaxID=28930 RepID=A0A2N9IHP1_FAGSY
MSLKVHRSTASDTLYPGQPLAWNQTLGSRNGIFELGFFTPGKSYHYYVGIWYKRIAEKSVVWVANRDSPVSDPSSSAIEISEDGYLMLQYRRVSYSESGNYESRIPNSTIGVLLDNGNFILTSKFHNNNIVLWQSFDYPTNTWLPGAKIVYDRLNYERTTTLWSWKNNENPESGRFSAELEIEENGMTHLVLNNWWYSEKLTQKELNNQYINVSYVSNNNESYFIYSAVSPSTFPRFVLNVTGELNLYVWKEDLRQWNLVWKAPPQPCEIFGFCGVWGICNQQKVTHCDCPNGFEPVDPTDWDLYDYSGGCKRRDPLQCSDGGIDTFLPIPNLRLSEAPTYPAVKNVEECKLNCLSDCFCNAYVYYNICRIYWGPLRNLQQLSSDNKSGGDLHIRISAFELMGSKNKISRKVAWIVGVLVAALISSIVSSIIWRVYYAVGALEEVEFSLILFKYQDIRRAKKNFSQKLGEGGFGSVFKGTLPNSTAIAVKKIRSLQQGEKQFRAEISTLGAIQHVNLLRLRGLAYLHESCRDCIIHFDVKPENILLDAEDVPKVADFGLAKVIGRDFSRVLTTMRGTRGYLAPGWISGEAVTPKVDVFSYGKLLFEIVSGEDLLTLLDYKLEGNANVEELTRACKVACWCIQDDPKDRPTMGQVVKILEGVMQVGIPQIPLYFQRLSENPTEMIVYHETGTSSSSY